MDRNPSPPPDTADGEEDGDLDAIGDTVYSKHWLFSTLTRLIHVGCLLSIMSTNLRHGHFTMHLIMKAWDFMYYFTDSVESNQVTCLKKLMGREISQWHTVWVSFIFLTYIKIKIDLDRSLMLINDQVSWNKNASSYCWWDQLNCSTHCSSVLSLSTQNMT